MVHVHGKLEPYGPRTVHLLVLSMTKGCVGKFGGHSGFLRHYLSQTVLLSINAGHRPLLMEIEQPLTIDFPLMGSINH